MPTQPPPQVPDVFGQNLDPNNAQSSLNQLQQNQQITNQGRQFSGREGAAGNTLGLLSKFIQGASLGRANADAKEAHSEAMKSSQDAQHLNSYIDMVKSNKDLDPDVANQLVAKAYSHQGQMVDTILKESDSPIAKILHPIFQGLMGGAPANESTKTDSKTGKKSKVKTEYKGPDEDAFKGLMSDYFNASQNQTIEKTYPVKSAALIDQAKAATAGLAQINGQEPTREQVQRAVAPLLSQGDALAQKYGMKSNPVADWIETYQPKENADAMIKRVEAEQMLRENKREDEWTGQTKTEEPPSAGNFMVRPPEERNKPIFDKLYGEKPQTQAQKDANTPPSVTNKQGERMDPAWMAAQVREGRATRKEETIKVGDGYKQVPIIYDFQGTPRDLKGFPIKPESIGKPVLENKDGKSLGMKYTDPDTGKEQVTLGIYEGNGAFKPGMIMVGDKMVPIRPMNTPAAQNKTLVSLDQHTTGFERMLVQKKTQLEAIENKIKASNPQYQFAMSPDVEAQFKAEVARQSGPLIDDIKSFQEAIETNIQILQENGADDLARSHKGFVVRSAPVPDQNIDQLNGLQ